MRECRAARGLRRRPFRRVLTFFCCDSAWNRRLSAIRLQLGIQIVKNIFSGKNGARALTDKILAACGKFREYRAGNGIHFAILLKRKTGGYEAAAPACGFHYQHAKREAADQAVADGKAAGLRRGGRRKFCQEQSLGSNLRKEFRVAFWIHDVNARAQHRDSPARMRQCGQVRLTVYAYRQPGNYGYPTGGELSGNIQRHGNAFRRAAA